MAAIADMKKDPEIISPNMTVGESHKEYTDEMEEVENKEKAHLYELHEEDGEKIEDYTDKLEEEEEEEVLVDTVSNEQAQEDRQPAVMK